jgi:hypothetical protein
MNSKGRPASVSAANRTLHDASQYRDIKMEKSAPYFRQTRVATCSHIVTRNGKSVAVQYPLDKTGWKHPNSYQNTKKSSETESWARTTF